MNGIAPNFVMETDRLVLRPLVQEDAPALFRIWSDPEVMEYLTLDPFTDVNQARDMVDLLMGLIEQGEGRRWTLTEKGTDRIIGTCGYHNVKQEHSRAEIGYEMARADWGRGIMSEALQALLKYCFTVMEFNRLEAFVTFGNERSVRILERAGFRQEGVLHDYEFARGKFQDQVILSLLRREWCERV